MLLFGNTNVQNINELIKEKIPRNTNYSHKYIWNIYKILLRTRIWSKWKQKQTRLWTQWAQRPRRVGVDAKRMSGQYEKERGDGILRSTSKDIVECFLQTFARKVPWRIYFLEEMEEMDGVKLLLRQLNIKDININTRIGQLLYRIGKKCWKLLVIAIEILSNHN